MVQSAPFSDTQQAEPQRQSRFQMTETIQRIARDRDSQAFQEFFLEFAPRVKALLLRQGADMATAEEIAQETMRGDCYSGKPARNSRFLYQESRLGSWSE